MMSEQLGKNVADALKGAAGRGVTVLLLIDGVGKGKHFHTVAKELENNKVEVRVHRPRPWQIELWRYSAIKTNALQKLFYFLLSINKRNHRKTTLIDHEHLFLGSINVSKNYLSANSGGASWRDTAISISNTSFKPIEHAFDASWNQAKWKTKRLIAKKALKSPFLLNYARRLRKYHDALLLRKIGEAHQHILITPAYFVPERTLLQALGATASKGVRQTQAVDCCSPIP